MSYAEFDGVVRFMVRAWTGIPAAARFTLRFYKEMSGTSRYLTKSLRTEKTIERSTSRVWTVSDLKFRGYAVKRKSPAKSRSPRYRNLRIKIIGKFEMPIDFLPLLPGYPRIDAIGQLSGSPSRKSR